MSRESKFLSLVLRHKPDEIGLQLDKHGWARVDELLRKLKKADRKLNRDELIQLVESNDKKHFTLSEDGLRIRTAQSHSVNMGLSLEPRCPPDKLCHGTASANLDAIFSDDLNLGRRHQVHLSLDPDTAERVGQRHRKPVVLRVEVQRMLEDGFQFLPQTTALGLPIKCRRPTWDSEKQHRQWSN